MRSPDVVIGAALAALGLYIAYEGHELGLGSLHEPGAGFILFWVGLALIVLALAIALSARFSGAAAAAPDFTGVRWRSIALVLAALAAYAAALEPVGFIPATFVMLLLLFRGIDPLPWTGAVLGAAATTAIVYAVFGLALGTQFPMGLLADR